MPKLFSSTHSEAKLQEKHRPTKYSTVICVTIALLLSIGQYPSYAQGHLQTWNTNQRERSQKLLSAAMTALNKGQVDQASNSLIQATLADPSDPVSLTMLGTTYVRQGKYSEALESLKKSYQLSKSAETLLSTGFAYYLQHDYDAAISSWSRALERDPKMVEANADIGFAHLRKGNFAQADESFRNLINARPNSQLAYQGLAVLNYLAGNFSAARKAAEHAQSIQSYYPVILLQAKLDYLQGDSQAGQKRVNEWLKASSGKRALVRPMTALGYPLQHDFHWDPFLADNFDNGRLLMARTQTNEKNGDSRRKSLASQGKSDALLSEVQRANSA
ncbi:MAG: tetratricopeptide repeat protein, partial [Candidatus Obscuribacterales bacterium]|nr:tetratricopeptide repeat protein [Candidatus Obscuribacterales bacterium]